ncbi:RNA polymerase sigma factor [Mesorhizobium sp. 2RAF21]|jgi:RNA polymerase sigma-70 factor (ECF subfamily)|uniref:RNA polymerase sigma factor n=1 Tax=Mesorhizobium sp. 2RAF21 TaxID=3232995 RepID=UPI003F94F208
MAMIQKPRSDIPYLRLVPGDAQHHATANDGAHHTPRTIRDVDWAILMARAQDGDSAAYLRLLQETTPYLRSLALGWYYDQQDIEDAVQDVFLTMHAIRHTYDPSRPFGPWLVAIASRRFVDRLRRQGRRRAHETPLTAEHETFIESGTNLEEGLDRIGLVAAIEKLPPRQQQAISLLKLKEMSLKEAAKVSGLSIVSLKVATHRALKSLRKMLTDGQDT